MNILKEYFKVTCLQLIFISICIVFLTIIRFFDSKNFDLIINEYHKYANFDTKISYVYQGEDS